MTDDQQEYVYRTPEGGWRITGSRVSLDSVVQAYWDGQTPEGIVTLFPSLTLQQVYGAIAFYLHRRTEIDAYLAGQEARWEQLRQASETRNGPLLKRLREARRSAGHPTQSS